MLIPKALNSISKVYKIKILKYDKHLNDSEEHIQASFRETCKQSLSKKVIKAILLTNFEFFQYNSLYLKILRYFDRYGTKPEMEWSILHHANNNISGASKICQICNLERMAILAEDSNQLLNKRRDISNNCVHNRRFFFK